MVIYALTQDPNTLTGAVARYLNALTERPFGVRCWAGVMGEREQRDRSREPWGGEQRTIAKAERIDIVCSFSSFF